MRDVKKPGKTFEAFDRDWRPSASLDESSLNLPFSKGRRFLSDALVALCKVLSR